MEGFRPETIRKDTRKAEVLGRKWPREKRRMAAEAWLWRWGWGWGQRCPGRPGLPGPGPGPTTFLHLLLLLGPVAADITDGNSEHLKREHSLIKPYQGEGGPQQRRVRTRARVGRRRAWPFLSSRAEQRSRFLARPSEPLSTSVSAHRGRFQFHAALGLPGQHDAYEPIRAPDPGRAQQRGLDLEPPGEALPRG